MAEILFYDMFMIKKTKKIYLEQHAIAILLDVSVLVYQNGINRLNRLFSEQTQLADHK